MERFSLPELAAVAIALDEDEEPLSGRKRRRWNIHPAWKKRRTEGEFATLYKELEDEEAKFYGYFRMDRQRFSDLLERLKPLLTKQPTTFQTPISPEERLAVTLRFLATGDSFKTISYSYRLGHATVFQIVKETCRAIVNTLMKEVMPALSEEKWKAIAEDFWSLWNFPNCIGALDGKHIVIEAPANSGSVYFNYKKTFSVILLALIDAHCNFITIDVGSFGRSSDGGVFSHSALGKRLESRTLNVPSNKCLPGTATEAPFVIVADEAFPLKTYLMRPYPGRQSRGDESKTTFNNRLSRARRVSENGFGILAQKFRIFRRTIKSSPENVDYIVSAACVLHNFIRQQTSRVERQMEIAVTSNSETNNISQLQNLSLHGGRATEQAFEVRETFREFLSENPLS